MCACVGGRDKKSVVVSGGREWVCVQVKAVCRLRACVCVCGWARQTRVG